MQENINCAFIRYLIISCHSDMIFKDGSGFQNKWLPRKVGTDTQTDIEKYDIEVSVNMPLKSSIRHKSNS